VDASTEADTSKLANETNPELATTPSAEPDATHRADASAEAERVPKADGMVVTQYFGVRSEFFDEAELQRAMGELRRLASEQGADLDLELRANSLVVRDANNEAVSRLVNALLASTQGLERAAENTPGEAVLVLSETYRQELVEACAEDFAGDIEALGKELELEGLTVRVLDGAVLELQMPTAPERLDELSEALFEPTNRMSFSLVSETPESAAYLLEVLEELPLPARPSESDGVCAKAVESLGSGLDILRETVATHQRALPAGTKAGYIEVMDSDAAPIWCLQLVEDRGDTITDDHLLQVYVAFDEQVQRPYVALTLDQEGSRRLEAVSSANIGRALALMVDDRIVSAPVLRATIPTGHVSIDLGPISSTADRARYVQGAVALARSLRQPTIARLLAPLKNYQPPKLDLGGLPALNNGELPVGFSLNTCTVRIHLNSVFHSKTLRDASSLASPYLGLSSFPISKLVDAPLPGSWLLFQVSGAPLWWLHSPGRAASVAEAYRAVVPAQSLPEYSFPAWSQGELELGGTGQAPNRQELHQRTEDDLLLGARASLRRLRANDTAPWAGPPLDLESPILVFGALSDEELGGPGQAPNRQELGEAGQVPNRQELGEAGQVPNRQELFAAHLRAGPPISLEIAVASEEKARELQRKLALLLAPEGVLSNTMAQLGTASKDGGETAEQLLAELRRAVDEASFVTLDGWVRLEVSLRASGPASELEPLLHSLATLLVEGKEVLQSLALAHYFVAFGQEHSQQVAIPNRQMTVFAWLKPSFGFEDEDDSTFQDAWGRALYVTPGQDGTGFNVCSPGFDGVSASADDLCVPSP
jgi:hypothetical protein